MIPSSSDLIYFIETASVLNLSRASERLGISQPSLTVAIQRLEQIVGTSLFIRSRKGVSLTQAGKQLLTHSRDLLQRWENIKGEALASSEEIRGRYTLGCHASVALYSLGSFLPDLLEKHPRLEVQLYHDLSRKVTESVVSLKTDIGIVVNPVKHPDLIIRKLCEDEVTFWVGPGNRKIQDFRSSEAILICDTELHQTQELLKRLEKLQIRYQRLLMSSNLEVVTRLVASGAGVGVIPSRVVASFGVSGLRRIPDAPVFRDKICLLYRSENRSVRSIQAISESAVRALSPTYQ